MQCVVELPVQPSVRDRLAIPGGIKDCQRLFYANLPQSAYDWRGIWGFKNEGYSGELYGLI